MKNLFVITSLLILSSCVRKNATTEPIRPVMKVIDSLGVKHLYAEAQWLMYARYCADTVKFHAGSLKNKQITFGELKLEIDTVTLVENEFTVGDSTWQERDLNFGLYFCYDTIMFDWRTVDNIMHYGVFFDLNNTNTRGFYNDGNFYITPYFRSDFLWPPYTGIKRYLERIGDKANPWFRQEAVKRGVIKE